MRRFCYITLLLLLPFSIQAKTEGQARIDSLDKTLSLAKTDTQRSNIASLISFYYHSIDPDKGIVYGDRAYNIALQMDWKRGMGQALNNIGLNYQYKSNYPKAVQYYFQALRMFEELGDKLGAGVSYSNLGVVAEAQKDYKKALEYGLKSLKNNESLRDSNNIAGDLGNIGNIYQALGDYKMALVYGKRALEIFTLLTDSNSIAHCLGNIGNAYNAQHQYADALKYDSLALNIVRSQGDKSSEALNLGNIGGVYLSMLKDSAYAKTPAQKAAITARAFTSFNACIAISRSIEQLDNLMEYNKGLSELYELTGDYKRAMACYTEYVTFKDSIYNTDNKVRIAQLETDRQLYLKDKEILLQQLEVSKKRTERILLIVGILVLVVVVIVIFRMLTRQRRSNRQLTKEKRRHLARIEAQTKMLTAIAYTQSHDVRGQVATILGLTQIFNFDNVSDPDNTLIIQGIAEETQKLDEIVRDIISKENELTRSHSEETSEDHHPE